MAQQANVFQQRTNLWRQYKEIEGATLKFLFDPDDPTLWTTRQLLVRLSSVVIAIDGRAKTRAINNLNRSNTLRQQAMNLVSIPRIHLLPIAANIPK
jgi:hypothetical protein